MTLAIIGGGEDPAGSTAALVGLVGLIKDLPQVQACLELRGPAAHDVWRCARRLDLLGHLSTIADAAAHRRLIGGCDVLLMPQRTGELRSIVLESMAVAMPLVVADDPCLDMFVAGETALVVGQASPDEWAQTLRRLLTEPGLPQRLGRNARAWVSRRHTAQLQVERLIGAFEAALRGGTRIAAGL